MNVTAVVPSLNPDEKFLNVVKGLVEAGFSSVILVDDGSRAENKIWFERALEYPQCTLLVHEVNRGKGRALKTAMEYFLSHNSDHTGVVTLDGDGQHAIPDVVNCAKALEEHADSLVLGVRSFQGAEIPARSRIGNGITVGVFRHLCGIPVTDTQTGLRGIPRAFCEYLLAVKGERFEFETNMLLETRRADMKIHEVPIRTVYLEENKSSHFRPFHDSMAIYWLIVKYLSSSLLSFVIDWGICWFLLWLFGRLTPSFGDVNIYLATAGARITSSLFNFFMNRTVVFRSKDGLGKTALRYYTLCVVQMLCSAGLVHLLALVGCPAMVGKIPVDVLLFFISFRIQRSWVFRK